MTPATPQILIVPHTHWDREWYQTAGRVQQRLVALVDALLDEIAGSDTPAPFLMDGQAIVLADYLAVRPERERELQRALAEGRLEAGPWYVLADNLIPSGEAILRNLEAGQRLLARFGAASPGVAYCPDSFGHPAAMPAIARGYGMRLIVGWRGFATSADTVWWTGLDGSRTLTHTLPPDGYECGSALPIGLEAAQARWSVLRTALLPRNVTGTMLLMNGADHHARQVGLPGALDALRAAAQSADDANRNQVHDALRDRTGSAAIELSVRSLREAAMAIVAAADAFEAAGKRLPETQGEQRGGGVAWALQGTFATRAHQKRTNAVLERALCWDTEPWLALALLHANTGGDGGDGGPQRDGRIGLRTLPSLLHHTWNALLATHPHDTLCGCSIDPVARAMDVAQDAVAAQQAGLRDATIDLVLGHDLVDARERSADGACIVIRNRVTRARSGVAEVMLQRKLHDVRVGPGSAVAATILDARRDVGGWHGALAVQRGCVTLAHDRRESPQHYPDDDIVSSERALLWVEDVPAAGLCVLQPSRDVAASAFPAKPVAARSTAGVLTVTNGMIALRVGGGRVVVTANGRTLPSALTLETVRDIGDTYTPSLRGATRSLLMVRARIGASGPLRGTVIVDWRYTDCSRPLASGDLEHYKTKRLPRLQSARVDVRTTLVVDAGSRTLRCDVVTRNRMRDHRLQLAWNTDVAPDATVRADVAFGHVVRTRLPNTTDDTEIAPGTMPMQRWACVSDAAIGATMISDGLAEAEVAGGRLAITLLRAVGELSRNNLPERPGHAGWPAKVPDAQSQGLYRARVGLLLHDAWSDATLVDIEAACDALLLPLVGETRRDLIAPCASITGPALAGVGLCASAITLARDGCTLLLRARNLANDARAGTWTLPGTSAWRVTECRLDETPISDTRTVQSPIGFTVPALGLTTLRLERVAG